MRGWALRVLGKEHSKQRGQCTSPFEFMSPPLCSHASHSFIRPLVEFKSDRAIVHLATCAAMAGAPWNKNPVMVYFIVTPHPTLMCPDTTPRPTDPDPHTPDPHAQTTPTNPHVHTPPDPHVHTPQTPMSTHPQTRMSTHTSPHSHRDPHTVASREASVIVYWDELSEE